MPVRPIEESRVRRVRPIDESQVKPIDQGGSLAEKISNMMESAQGAVETGAALGTSALAEPVAGISGIVAGLTDDQPGFLGPAVSAINRVRQGMTYQPKTPKGQRYTDIVSTPFEMLHKGAVGAGEFTQDITGGLPAPLSNILATTVQTGIEMAPGAVGLRGAPSRVRARRQGIADVREGARDLGFDTKAEKDVQTQQLVDAAEAQRGGVMQKGDVMEDIQRSVQAAKEQNREFVNAKYAEAREAGGGISAERFSEFSPQVEQALASFDVDSMPIVKKRIDELKEFESQLPPGSSVRLNGMEMFRQRLIRNKASVGDRSQNAAIGIIKNQLDEFLDTTFNADMIKGSPEAIQKWKDARLANSMYRERFSANKTIEQLAEKEATPEEMRNWIFGASAVNAKKQASDTVRRLKDIVGEDSPEMVALRQDALLDIMEPLLREEPSLKSFVNNYDKFVRNNPRLAAELFPSSMAPLKRLRDFSAATMRRKDPLPSIDLQRLGAVALLGHGIARAGAKVRVATDIFKEMTGKSTSAQRQIMGGVLGYDPYKPVIPKTPAVIGALQSGQRESDNAEEGR